MVVLCKQVINKQTYKPTGASQLAMNGLQEINQERCAFGSLGRTLWGHTIWTEPGRMSRSLQRKCISGHENRNCNSLEVRRGMTCLRKLEGGQTFQNSRTVEKEVMRCYRQGPAETSFIGMVKSLGFALIAMWSHWKAFSMGEMWSDLSFQRITLTVHSFIQPLFIECQEMC